MEIASEAPGAVPIRVVPALLVLAAAVTSCGDGDQDAIAPALGLDFSSAVRLTSPGWPEVRVIDRVHFPGGDEGSDSELDLHYVRDLLVTEDDGILVAHAGASEVLRLDSSGSVVWRSGRAGEGPGEFGALSRLQAWEGDTVVAVDPALNRATFLSGSGEPVRVRSGTPELPQPEAPVLFTVPGQAIGVAPTGELVVLGPTHAFRRGEPGLRRARTRLLAVRPPGEEGETETMADLPGLRAYELRDPQSLPAILAPMSAGTPVALHADLFVWARTDAFQVVVFDRHGRVHRVLAVEEPLDPVTGELRAEYLENWQPWFPVEEPIPFPSHVPAFDRVFVSGEGDIWARRFHWDEGPEVWARFAGEGGELDLFRFPDRVRVMTAAAQHAFGVHRDEREVERVVRLPLGDDPHP